MSAPRLLAVVASGLTVAASFWFAAPASADDDGMPPCTLGIICAFIPGGMDLDHDVDLTKDQPPMPNQDNQRPVDPCIDGCI